MAEHLVRQSAQDEFGRTAPEPAGSGSLLHGSNRHLQPRLARMKWVGTRLKKITSKPGRAHRSRCSYRWPVPYRVLCLPIPPLLYFDPAGAGRGRCQEQPVTIPGGRGEEESVTVTGEGRTEPGS